MVLFEIVPVDLNACTSSNESANPWIRTETHPMTVLKIASAFYMTVLKEPLRSLSHGARSGLYGEWEQTLDAFLNQILLGNSIYKMSHLLLPKCKQTLDSLCTDMWFIVCKEWWKCIRCSRSFGTILRNNGRNSVHLYLVHRYGLTVRKAYHCCRSTPFFKIF